ncbi:MAG: hypothetical protein IT556_13680 [Acetobacteraceae bacterium]|nr:hypothetical protein [Acetobacteraceae bacterium]
MLVEGHRVGQVLGFAFRPDDDQAGDGQRALLRAARRTLGREIRARLRRLEAASDAAFTLDAGNRVLWHAETINADPAAGVPIARLRSGATIARPRIEPIDSEFLDQAARRAIAARLDAWLSGRIEGLLAPLAQARRRAARHPSLRGLVHLLDEGLGIAPAPDAAAALPSDHSLPRRLGIQVGVFASWLAPLLKPHAMQLRAHLLAAHTGMPMPAIPPPGAISVPTHADFATASTLLHGWVSAGPVLVRLDVAERIVRDLDRRAGAGELALPPDLASRLGCRAALLPAVLRSLGFRLVKGEAGALVLRPRRNPRAPRPRAVPANPAFAALAALKP